MNLEMFTTSRQERALDGLLKLLMEVVEKHTEEQVLDRAFKTLELFCNPQLSIFGRCNAKREKLLEDVALQFRESLDEFNKLVTEEHEIGNDELFEYELSFRKISVLYKYHDLGNLMVWEVLYETVRKDVDSHKDDTIKEPEAAVMFALLGCYYGLMWDRKTGRRTDLRSKVDRFMTVCREFVVHSPSSRLAEEGFISVCDLLVLFGARGGDVTVRPNELMVEEMLRYLEEEIFSDKERVQMEEENDEDMVVKVLKKR